MAIITLRNQKGAPLTNAEVDSNFTNLNTEISNITTIVGTGVIGTSNNVPDTTVKRDATGGFSAGIISATDFNSTSDITVKDNISTINEAFDILNKINPVEFTWKNNNKKSYGVIAQEIELILPELVETHNTGLKGVSYIPLIAMLVSAVKELNTRLNTLESK